MHSQINEEKESRRKKAQRESDTPNPFEHLRLFVAMLIY